MEKKIIPLNNQHVAIGVTHPSVVTLLEKLIGQAERGELLGISVAWVEGNNDVVFQISQGSASSSLMVAAVAALDFEIRKRWSEK